MSKRHSYHRKNLNSGSPGNGEPEFLAVGKLHRAHGVHGEIRMSVWTDFPERLCLMVYKKHFPGTMLVFSLGLLKCLLMRQIFLLNSPSAPDFVSHVQKYYNNDVSSERYVEQK